MKFKDIVADRREICAGNLERRPTVSIVTPTYKRNLEGLLAPCIESALSQSLTDIELIVIDDGSSDGTEDTVRGYAKLDDRIRYYRHDQNSGLPAVRTNEGIMLARGQSVAFLFDDNVLAPDFIQRAHAELSRSEVDVVHARVHMLGLNGADFTLGDWPLCQELIGNLNTIPNGGVLCRKRFFETFGLYDPHILLRRICDWDLWLRTATLGASFKYLDIVAATEHGLISENSIGNTVAWDVKVAYGYMFDSRHYKTRSTALLPQNIGELDVLSTQAILPYVRNVEEWKEIVEKVYQPLASRNKAAASYPTALTNRTQIDHFGFSRDKADSKLRRRSLLVCNTFDAFVATWEGALSSNGDICIHTPEWQLSSVPPSSVDLLVLIDCCAPFLLPFVHNFVEAGVPILYVANHGLSNAKPGTLDFSQVPPIRKVLGEGLYFPAEGVPFSGDQARSALQLQSISTAVVAPQAKMSELSHQWVIGAPDQVSIQWLRNISGALRFCERCRDDRAGPVRPKAIVALNSELLSGSEAYGIMLAQELLSVGFDVRVWIPGTSVYGMQDNALADRLAESGLQPAIEIPYETGGSFFSHPAEVQARQADALSRALSVADADLIVCCGFMPVFSWADRGQAVLLGALFQPSAYDPQHLQKIAGKIDGWVSDSQWSHDILRTVLGGSSGVVRSVVVTQSATVPARPKGPVRIALGGTLQPRKAQIQGVKALHALRKMGIDAVLNLYGYVLPSLDWYKKELDAAIVALNLRDCIAIKGFVDLDEMGSTNDIVLSTSIDESLPQTVAECMARGLVPVAVLAGGVDELVHDGVNGFVASSSAPGCIAEALAKAVNMEARWQAMRDASKTILAEFSQEKATSDLLRVLIGAAHAPRRAGQAIAVTPTASAAAIRSDADWTARVSKLESLKQSLASKNAVGKD